ncbi:MAG: phosphoserine phosphatase [Thermoprotei archaeon]|nr:MAG: phosphoserine phosphatase [Thermoprotei archaeon]
MSLHGIVFFDCDGVLTDNASSWQHLHEYFRSYDNSYFAKLYEERKISYLDWMKIDIALMINSWGKPIKFNEVEKAFKEINLRSDAYYVIKTIKQMGFIVGVISSGIDVLVKKICKELSVDICLYNELYFDEKGELIPGGKDWVPLLEKPFLIQKIAKGLGFTLDRVVYVGDSKWDIPVFRIVGLSVAIKPCNEACKEAKYTIDSLSDLIPVIKEYFNIN